MVMLDRRSVMFYTSILQLRYESICPSRDSGLLKLALLVLINALLISKSYSSEAFTNQA